MALRRVDIHFDSTSVLQLYPETQEAVYIERFAYSGMPHRIEKTTIGRVHKMLTSLRDTDREGEDDG